MNNVRSATYSYASALIDPPATNDVTDEYQNFLGYMFGFGARMKLKKIPLAVSLSSRFMYSPNDAGGVDAMGTSLSIYPAEYKTNAASVGIHFGMVYLIHWLISYPSRQGLLTLLGFHQMNETVKRI